MMITTVLTIYVGRSFLSKQLDTWKTCRLSAGWGTSTEPEKYGQDTLTLPGPLRSQRKLPLASWKQDNQLLGEVSRPQCRHSLTPWGPPHGESTLIRNPDRWARAAWDGAPRAPAPGEARGQQNSQARQLSAAHGRKCVSIPHRGE